MRLPPNALRYGLPVAFAGLAIAASGLVAGRISPIAPMLLLFCGAFVYLPGSFLIVMSPPTEEKKRKLTRLRYVRLAFAAVVIGQIVQIANGA